MCILPEKELNTLLLFIINLGHDEVKISKGCTLAYMSPDKYDNHLDVQENNQAGEIANISITTSKTNAEILPAFPSASKMIFPCDLTPVRKVLLQDVETSADAQEKLDRLKHAFKDIML